LALRKQGPKDKRPNRQLRPTEIIRNPNKTKSPTEKTKKPNGENKKAQVLSGAAYITASQRALNIFFSKFVVCQLTKKVWRDKKEFISNNFIFLLKK